MAFCSPNLTPLMTRCLRVHVWLWLARICVQVHLYHSQCSCYNPIQVVVFCQFRLEQPFPWPTSLVSPSSLWARARPTLTSKPSTCMLLSRHSSSDLEKEAWTVCMSAWGCSWTTVGIHSLLGFASVTVIPVLLLCLYMYITILSCASAHVAVMKDKLVHGRIHT